MPRKTAALANCWRRILPYGFMADPVERKILRPEKFTHPLPTIPPEEAMEPFGAAGSV